MADRLDAARDAALRSIYLALGGDETLLVRKRSGSDPRLDFVLAEHALAVEVDEIQHFTSERLRTLDLYPPAAEVCFDTGAYRALIGRWCTTGDRYRAAKPSVDFPFAGGRRAQRLTLTPSAIWPHRASGCACCESRRRLQRVACTNSAGVPI